jgi:hypothetical protein
VSIESTVRTYVLTGNAALTNLIGQRLYYMLAPQEVIKPYVVYSVLDDPNTKMLVGSDGANPVLTFRIVVARDRAVDMITISDAIRAKINDFTGMMAAADVYIIECVNIRDFPPEADNDLLERFCDYQVNYQR